VIIPQLASAANPSEAPKFLPTHTMRTTTSIPSIMKLKTLFAAAALCVAGNLSASANTLLLNWNFDNATSGAGGIGDLSGNNRNGTLNGTAFIADSGSGVSGQSGDRAFNTGALPADFSSAVKGSATYQGALADSSLDSYTITFWYKADEVAGGGNTTLTGGRRLFRVQGSASDRQFLSNNNANGVVTLNYNSSGSSEKDNAPAAATGEWIFMALVYDGSISTPGERVKLYIGTTDLNATFDTVFFNDPSTSINWTGLTSTFSFGSNRDNSAAFVGLMDDVRLYSGALTEQDIRFVQASAIPEPSASVAVGAMLAVGFAIRCCRS